MQTTYIPRRNCRRFQNLDSARWISVRTLWIVCIAACWLLAARPAAAEVRLPRVIGSHMVLQRDAEVPIWGWADPGEVVQIEWREQTFKTTADDNGDWTVRLPATPAGGPHAMTIRSSNEIHLQDILVGEVWLCSGQSNMEWGIRSVANGEAELAQADHPRIRLFKVPKITAASPQSDLDAEWKVCTPQTLGTGGWLNQGFSAVAYFFGRHLQGELDVPIGLIDSSWGGTRIEPWTPPVGFASIDSLADIARTIDEAGPAHAKAVADAVPAYEAWLPKARKALDAGEEIPSPPEWPRHPLDGSAQPTGIYNAMIHPLIPFGIRGAIWYQGESNYADGMLYHDKMKALIGGWRTVWKQSDFPFYFVQLAPFGKLYSGEQLPRIWEAQAASLSIANTGMVVTVDIGDVADIHPANKHDVGKRLALWALAKDYGGDVVFSGPLYESMSVEGSKIRLKFKHVGSGLRSRDGQPLTEFSIAGADQQFASAQAEIDGDTVLVWSDDVPDPVAVRFAWRQTAQPNLMNAEGLPASPFRTDGW